ncbi:hypothetical protein [Streptomyces sp. NPDC056883]|uniref:hypothetical protein n=1 Tax=Streptomyces sp. NPDC056883 TaxID=3345959 RepID=UPI0036A8DCC1
MRRRILGFTAALVLAVLGTAVPATSAVAPTVTGAECIADQVGTVEYDSGTGLYTCIGGAHDGEPITTS